MVIVRKPVYYHAFSVHEIILQYEADCVNLMVADFGTKYNLRTCDFGIMYDLPDEADTQRANLTDYLLFEFGEELKFKVISGSEFQKDYLRSTK